LLWDEEKKKKNNPSSQRIYKGRVNRPPHPSFRGRGKGIAAPLPFDGRGK